MPSRYLHLWLVGAFALALFALAIDETVADDSAPLFDVYAISADADADVVNDLMRVTLVAQAEDADPARLADTINTTMQWALDELADREALTLETLGYQTRPRYEGQSARRIVGWYASQSLQVESSDFEAVSAAIATLQQRLQVQGMQLSTRADTRRLAQDALIESALEAFRERARLVQTSMGSASYRVIDVSVSTDNYAEPIYAERSMRMQADAAQPSSAPAVAAGSSRITVRIDGRIQLE